MNELVSVIVPIFNTENVLEKSVLSVVKQTYTNIEIILVDDGSQDGSLRICQQLEARYPCITVIHTENKGSGHARNMGIDAAKGKYLYFPDADDCLTRDAIEVMVNAASEDNIDLVVFGFANVNTSGDTISENKYPSLVQDSDVIRHSYSPYMGTTTELGIQGAPWNKLFCAQIVSRHHVRYPDLRRHQDEVFISRYMCYSKRVKFIPNVLYRYYTNDLRKEWDKYPKDYVDSVIGLYNSRKETILTWNPDDRKTAVLISKEYICNCVKAIELTFSNKYSCSYSDRARWIHRILDKTDLKRQTSLPILRKYHRIVLWLAKHNFFVPLYLIVKAKVEVQKCI